MPAGYLECASRTVLYASAPLVGHGSLRVAVAGLRQGPLATAGLDRLSGMLDDALAVGARVFPRD